MRNFHKTQVEIAALHALANWETLFSEEVRRFASQIAGERGSPSYVALSDYQQAAPLALQSLARKLEQCPLTDSDGKQKAA